MRYIIIFFTIITLSISNECPGDVNIDNSINIQDIILISNHTLNLNSLEDEGLINADINTNYL